MLTHTLSCWVTPFHVESHFNMLSHTLTFSHLTQHNVELLQLFFMAKKLVASIKLTFLKKFHETYEPDESNFNLPT